MKIAETLWKRHHIIRLLLFNNCLEAKTLIKLYKATKAGTTENSNENICDIEVWASQIVLSNSVSIIQCKAYS